MYISLSLGFEGVPGTAAGIVAFSLVVSGFAPLLVEYHIGGECASLPLEERGVTGGGSGEFVGGSVLWTLEEAGIRGGGGEGVKSDSSDDDDCVSMGIAILNRSPTRRLRIEKVEVEGGDLMVKTLRALVSMCRYVDAAELAFS